MNEDKQTVLEDGFSESLKNDGIVTVIPEMDLEELPAGIGSTGFTPRLTAPSYSNPYFIRPEGGGYNYCIRITGNSVLPNCVGYVYGRFLEEAGLTKDARLPRCNAEDWYSMAQASGMKVGQVPKLGAIVVWNQGNFWNGNDGCGHVAVVERINQDKSILVSQSNYGGTRFELATIPAPYNCWGQRFVGFIYNDHIVEVQEPIKKKVTVPTQKNAVYRLYHKNSGRHFFTAGQKEAENLANNGWVYEGIAWIGADEGDPVWRLYSRQSGFHHYTASKAEKDILLKTGRWIDEGVMCRSDASETVPIYRVRSKKGDHLFTAAYPERNFCLSAGWSDEKIGFYAKEKAR